MACTGTVMFYQTMDVAIDQTQDMLTNMVRIALRTAA